MTVEEMREKLGEYPGDAVVEVYEERRFHRHTEAKVEAGDFELDEYDWGNILVINITRGELRDRRVLD